MEHDGGRLHGDVLVSMGSAPEVAIEQVQRYRDVKYYETLYELLAKQYELARVDEARNATVIQALDRAVVPDKKSSPKRALIVLFTAAATLVFGVFAAFTIEALRNAKRYPEVQTKMQVLRSQFKSP
jgi:uncharacterized protein involved in exopolysaccharide biosynthesis